MTRIAPVRLAHSSKTLWFDALEYELVKDQAVVVTTARGVEFGTMAEDVFEATEEQIKQLKSPLKPVTRLATQDDVEQASKMEALGEEALPVFREIAAETNEDMHPVSVEYLLEGDKAIFYFEAEDRVDFRELVRRLAAHFHVRVDMRQIGVRDEARLVGGLGHCGQELCCKRLGGEFNPVSIRMAKEQDLSLNPQKISGLCGRLMCCLRYEFDAYKDFKSRAPKQGSTIQTPDGPAKVITLDVPREIVTLKLEEDEKTFKISLSEFDAPQSDATRPSSIGAVAWERAKDVAAMGSLSGATFLTSQFTQNDKVGSATAVHHEASAKPMPSRKQASKKSGKQTATDEQVAVAAKPRKRRRSTKVGVAGESNLLAQERSDAVRHESAIEKNQASEQAKRKRRRSRKTDASAKNAGVGTLRGEQIRAEAQSADQSLTASKQGPRPGQKSSGLRQAQNAALAKQEQAFGEQASEQSGRHPRARRRNNRPARKTEGAPLATGAQTQSVEAAKPKQDARRRSRRRSRKAQGGAPEAGANRPSSNNNA